MTKNTKYLLFVSLGLVLSFAACSTKPNAEGEQVAQEIIDFTKVPSMTGEGVSTLVSDSGRLTYRMRAPRLAIYDKIEKPYWDMPEGLHMTTYSAKGEAEGDIKSKFAIYHMDEELWELRKEVVAVNLDGNKVETELMFWDRKKKEIYSDQLVRITEDGMITTGTGFKSNEDFTDWSLDEFTTEFILDE